MNNGSEAATIAVDSLGCKLNQAEAELLARQLAEAGYRLVSPDDEADIYVLNTCTVTSLADRKCRHRLRLARRHNPNARLVAIGCLAQRAPQELGRIEGVDLVLGNDHKSRLLQSLSKSGCEATPHADRHPTGQTVSVLRTRTFIKVQEGCSSFCSYCIVPVVRGGEKSSPVDHVLAEVRRQVSAGYKEVVLTGTKIGSYSHNGDGLKGLLEHILADTGVARLRLSSLQPQEITPGLIRLWQDDRLCRHFHLALQSGSDGVLARMRRRYSVGEYERSVSLIRAALPEAAITTDVIVGFPGETESEFQQGYDFCRRMDFARIHVFPYSPRQDTEAAGMPGMVADRIKKRRSQKMLALAEVSAQNFRQQFLGKIMPVLWEKQTDGIWSGLTDNYIKVYVKSDQDLRNRLLPVKLGEVRRDGVWGEMIAPAR
ncbi:MAG: tRNA (N(6)-L-threonylcarbamoyladenosine(37)-C(2))-methylthiotransferase MtaB [Chloroflexi bacterium]|nr:tRNA (N(6)-L-threonylcarbamoyladenosine(37)-C(2))-methylthiotransferase MtaB [Chloroflexota bacterium]